MFDLEQAIAEWRRQVSVDGFKDDEALNELESHLRDEYEQLMTSGLTAQEAFNAAVEHIGPPGDLKDEFAKLGLRDRNFFKRLKIFLLGVSGIRAPSLSDFSPISRQALELAREEAPRLNHTFIGTEHVLLGLLKSQSDVLSNVMRRMGVTSEKLRSEIERWVGMGNPATPIPPTIPYTPRAMKALALAAREAETLQQSQVSPELMFLGLVKEGNGVAALALKSLGVDIKRTRDEIVKEMKLRESNG